MTYSTKEKISPAPAGLSPEARRFWQKILRAWELNPGEMFTLQQACEALDTLRVAEALVKSEGPLIVDRFGIKRAHPATLMVRDARNALLKCLKQLGLKDELDIKAKRPPGRPERTYPRGA